MAGYESLYDSGVCHRDISLSNILIDAKSTQASAGLLIDVACAKQGQTPRRRLAEVLDECATSDAYSRAASKLVELIEADEELPNIDKKVAMFLLLCRSETSDDKRLTQADVTQYALTAMSEYTTWLSAAPVVRTMRSFFLACF
jgi:serine/threonine protein kinase